MNSDQRLLQWQKRQLMLALIVTCLLAVVMASLAWLYHVRSLQTATRVYVPALWIDNIHGANAMNLGEIDVLNAEEYTTDENGKPKPCRRYAFAVCSNSPDTFRVQLAYTTNIGFDYKLYPAREDDPREGEKSYQVVASDVTHTYSYSTPLDPRKPDKPEVQNHEATYGNYDHVQEAAEPKYWVSSVQTLNPVTDGSYATQVGSTYTCYFVLEISWDSTLTNSKDTDMVYLMAENAE